MAPALEAFLATSRDFRAETESSTRAFLGRENLQLGRQASQRAEEAGERAQEKHEVFLEEADFERETLRPLQVEALQLRTQAQAFDLTSRRNAELLKGQEINEFQKQTQLLRNVFTGKLDVGGQTTFKTETKAADGGVATADNINEDTVYWDHGKDRALLATIGPDDNVVLTDKAGNVVQPGEKMTLSKVRSFEPGEIKDSQKVLSQTQSPGSLGDMQQLDRVRNANGILQQMKLTYGGRGNKAIDREIATMEAAMQHDPHYQMAQARGQLIHPAMREFQQRQGVEQTMDLLQLQFGDEGAHDFADNNPATMRTLADMDPVIRARQIAAIAERQRDEEKEDPDVKKRRVATEERGLDIRATQQLLNALEAEKISLQQRDESTRDIDEKIDKAEDELRTLKSEAAVRPTAAGARPAATPSGTLNPESFVKDFLQ